MQKHSSLIRAAVDNYSMIENGDRIAVGISGGKDSMALLAGLYHLNRYYPKRYKLIAITADPCFGGKETDYSEIEKYCKENGIEYVIRRTELYKIVFETIEQRENPCSLCATMRRGILHKMAKELDCNKLALGHHSEDAAETFLMNLFQGGNVGSFRPLTYLSRADLTVIRPMIYCDEQKIATLCERCNLPVVKSLCPVDKNTEREKIKTLMTELSQTYPDLKRKIIGAMERGEISGWK